MNSPPKITLITPTLNQAQYLEETIQSVLSQNYPNLEYIIVDGGSTDGSVDIIRKYEQHLAWWVSEPDRGQSHAINKGLERATGEIFNWVNSDDLLAPGALWTVAKAFSERPDAHIICGQYTVITETKRVGGLRMKVYSNLEKTMIFGHVSPCSMYYRLPVLKLLGRFDERLHYCMDLEMWWRYLEKYGLSHFLFIDENLAFFRWHQASKSISQSFQFSIERLNLQISLMKSLQAPQDIINKMESLQSTNFYDRKWSNFKLHKKAFTAHSIHDQLQAMNKRFSWSEFLGLYFQSLLLRPLGRHWRFYLLPARRIKWCFEKS